MFYTQRVNKTYPIKTCTTGKHQPDLLYYIVTRKLTIEEKNLKLYWQFKLSLFRKINFMLKFSKQICIFWKK